MNNRGVSIEELRIHCGSLWAATYALLKRLRQNSKVTCDSTSIGSNSVGCKYVVA